MLWDLPNLDFPFACALFSSSSDNARIVRSLAGQHPQRFSGVTDNGERPAAWQEPVCHRRQVSVATCGRGFALVSATIARGSSYAAAATLSTTHMRTHRPTRAVCEHDVCDMQPPPRSPRTQHLLRPGGTERSACAAHPARGATPPRCATDDRRRHR